MTKNTNFVSHKKSKQKVGNKPQLPLAESLVEGEIAINFAEGVETLSIKNDSGDVVTFSSDNYYTEEKLGSGFTGENSAVTVTEAIETIGNEVDVTSGDTPTGQGIELWIDESIDPTEVDAYTKSETNALLAEKLDVSAYTELWVEGTGNHSVVQKGGDNDASGDYSVAEGNGTSATSDASHSEGYRTLADEDSAHAEGSETKATGGASHAEGSETIASEYAAHAEGDSTSATSDASHTEGDSTFTEGYAAHAEGYVTSATSEAAHAEGYRTLASGEDAHAEGSGTIAEGDCSHAEGLQASATSYESHAEGYRTLASNYAAHAEGYYTIASGDSSHAEGSNTIASNFAEHASGQFNVSNTATTTFGHSGNTLFSVGNGTDDNARHNALEIRQNGDIYIASGNTDVKLQDKLVDNINDYYKKSETSGATEISTALAGKSDTGHTHASSEITAMTNYTSGVTISPITSSDSLNTAIGKLEHALGGVKLTTISQAAYDALVADDNVDPTTLYVIID